MYFIKLATLSSHPDHAQHFSKGNRTSEVTWEPQCLVMHQTHGLCLAFVTTKSMSQTLWVQRERGLFSHFTNAPEP